MNCTDDDGGAARIEQRRAMRSAALRKVGSIGVIDIDMISRFYGREFLPYPFMFTRPSKFSEYDQLLEYERSLLERFNNGDLSIFQRCAATYTSAEIRVECHVQYIPADTPDIRVLAFRFNQDGFLAKQRPDEDLIDIYELSPYLLGSAVADWAGLTKPGRRSNIVIPEYVRAPDNARASEDLSIQHAVERAPNAVNVPRPDVTAFGTVQTHWRPTRRWGIDPGKEHAVWVGINDDGEYLYKPDFTTATPLTPRLLAERIDRLISEDIKALRQFRSE
jgi:ESAT-6 protein secretion system EspG family protein